MQMKNIKIIHGRQENYWVVVADTERFGTQEVMFEGNNIQQCIDYIEREVGNTKWKAYARDIFNIRQEHAITHYKDGHYSYRSSFAGKKAGKYTRTSKVKAMNVMNDICKKESRWFSWKGGEAV